MGEIMPDFGDPSDPFLEVPDLKPDDEHWVTQDKRRLRPAEMTDAHLLNTVRMIRRKALAWRKLRMQEFPASGELMRPLSHDELAQLMLGCDILDTMLEECHRRGFGNVENEEVLP